MNNIEKKISVGIFYQLLSFFVSGLVSLLFIPFTVSKLGKVQYGIFEMVVSLTLINALLEIGIGSTITNYAKKYYDENIKKYTRFFWTFFWFKLGIALVAFIFCFFVSAQTAYIFKKVAVEDINILSLSIKWFAFGIIITNLVSFFDNLLNGFVRYDISSQANIASKIFYISAFFYWLWSFENINISQFCLLTFVFVPIFRLIIQVIFIFYKQKHILKKPVAFNYSLLKSKYNYIGGLSAITIFAQTYKYGVLAVLSLISAPSLVGEFGIIKRVLDLVSGISDALVRPIMPAAKDLLKKHSFKNIVYKTTSLHALIILSLTTLIIINAPALSSFYLKGNYTNFDIHLAIMTLPRLIPSAIVILMLYYSEGKTKINIINQLLRLIVAIPFAFLGFQYFDFLGLLIGLSLGTTVVGLYNINQFLVNYNKLIIKQTFYKVYYRKWLFVGIAIIIHLFIKELLGVTYLSIILWNSTTLLVFYFAFRKEIVSLANKFLSRLL